MPCSRRPCDALQLCRPAFSRRRPGSEVLEQALAARLAHLSADAGQVDARPRELEELCWLPIGETALHPHTTATHEGAPTTVCNEISGMPVATMGAKAFMLLPARVPPAANKPNAAAALRLKRRISSSGGGSLDGVGPMHPDSPRNVGFAANSSRRAVATGCMASQRAGQARARAGSRIPAALSASSRLFSPRRCPGSVVTCRCPGSEVPRHCPGSVGSCRCPGSEVSRRCPGSVVLSGIEDPLGPGSRHWFTEATERACPGVR